MRSVAIAAAAIIGAAVAKPLEARHGHHAHHDHKPYPTAGHAAPSGTGAHIHTPSGHGYAHPTLSASKPVYYGTGYNHGVQPSHKIVNYDHEYNHDPEPTGAASYEVGSKHDHQSTPADDETIEYVTKVEIRTKTITRWVPQSTAVSQNGFETYYSTWLEPSFYPEVYTTTVVEHSQQTPAAACAAAVTHVVEPDVETKTLTVLQDGYTQTIVVVVVPEKATYHTRTVQAASIHTPEAEHKVAAAYFQPAGTAPAHATGDYPLYPTGGHPPYPTGGHPPYPTGGYSHPKSIHASDYGHPEHPQPTEGYSGYKRSEAEGDYGYPTPADPYNYPEHAPEHHGEY